jgi:hypothetical protein
MPFFRFAVRAASVGAIAGLLAACGHGAGTILPSGSLGPQTIALPDAHPPKCEGQQDTKQYASLSVTLQTSGGTFCIPEFRGFGGKVRYPGANPSVQLSLISSTTDYDHLPQLGSGTAIFYLQLAISGKTTFGDKVRAGGGLTSKKIEPSQAYTVFGEAIVYSIPIKLSPCYTIAKKGKYGGVIGGIGTLLKGESVPVKASGFIEIYSGRQANTEC